MLGFLLSLLYGLVKNNDVGVSHPKSNKTKRKLSREIKEEEEEETCTASERIPAAFAMGSNVIDEYKIFFDSPWSSSEVHLLFTEKGGATTSAAVNIHSD